MTDGAPYGYFEGLPRVDATEPLLLRVTKRDTDGAEPANPYNCALARACKRQHGAKAAAVMLSIAYVDVGDGKGHREARRYVVSRGLTAAQEEFDLLGSFPLGVYELLPPPPSRRLGYQPGPRKAPTQGKRLEPKDKKPRKKPLRFHGVRNGTSMVHFSREPDA